MKQIKRSPNFIKTMLCVSLLAFSSFSNMLWAQSCADRLEESAALYEKGLFSDVITLIKDCSQSEDKNEQWKAHRLLALAYLANNEQVLARQEAVNMLKLNPTYKGSSLRDPSELIKLLASITVIPKLSLGMALSIGTNSTIPKINDVYMVAEQVKNYQGQNSFQFGVSSTYQINQNFALDLTVMASSKIWTKV
jgi:hypothetical protein